MGKFIVWLIKDRLTTLVVFAILGVIAIALAPVARLVLGWLDYDESSKDKVSEGIGVYVAFALFVVAGISGHVLAARAKRKQPPPLPPWVKPLPPVYPEAQRQVPPRYET